MHTLKRYFILPWLGLCMLASAHVAWMLFQLGWNSPGWLAAALALWPLPLFFLYLGLVETARTSRYLLLPLTLTSLGVVFSLVNFQLLPGLYALIPGLGGLLLYLFWYSPLDRGPGAELVEGARLPAFELQDTDGNSVSSESFLGRKSLWLFYRGNWCPLCVTQVKELAQQYRELQQRDVAVVLVSPQPAEQTRKLAQRFDAPMEFLVDCDNRAAIQLGLLHQGGVPAGMTGYGEDTVMPTVIMADESGKILFSDLTDNYRVRPEPQTFLQVLDAH